jgi:AcrR family transcriptional regulator
MPRPAKFSEPDILDAAAELVAVGGPGAATIGAIGAALSAPWGSIYHRFPARHELLGRLWLSKAAMFQNRFAAALAHRHPFTAGLEAALSLPRTARADFVGARVMLLYRREDFLADDWPRPMRDEAIRLRRQVDEVLGEITRRMFGGAGSGSGAESLRIATFAVLDVPFAATHRHVAANEPPPPYVDSLIERAYRALVTRRKPTPATPLRRSGGP